MEYDFSGKEYLSLRFQILLSTYNGERYLKSQLDSYLALSNYENVSVLIRDDGSTDGTAEILKEYRDKYGFEVIFGENLGLNKSVYELIEKRDRECDLYAFSDQDDVWLPDKLVRAEERLSSLTDEPAMYAGTSYLAKGEELEIIGKTSVPKKPLSFYNAMVENVCIGHTVVINASLAELYEGGYSDGIFVFDYWAYLLASVAGRIVFDSEPGALYRQHDDNAIGYKASFLGKMKVRIGRVFAGKSYYNALQLHSFLEVYADIIPEEYVLEAQDFFKSERSFFTRLGYIFRTKAYRNGFAEGLIFRLMYLFGRYDFKKAKQKINNIISDKKKENDK